MDQMTTDLDTEIPVFTHLLLNGKKTSTGYQSYATQGNQWATSLRKIVSDYIYEEKYVIFKWNIMECANTKISV